MKTNMLVGVLWAGLALGCAPDLDVSRESVDTGSFGSTVVTLACKRIAYLHDREDGDARVDVRGDVYRSACRGQAPPPPDAPDALEALLAEREPLAAAIDAALPEELLPDLQAFLTSPEFLALYDDDTTTAAVDALIELLRFAAEDPEVAPAFHDALVRLEHRSGYAPLAAALGALHAVLRYPDMHELLREVTGAIATGGSAADEWSRLIEATSITMRHAEPAAEPFSPQRTGALAVELLLSEHALLGTGQPMGLVRRDPRGIALVRRNADGQMPSPFRDADGDGLADVDDLGRFVGDGGALLGAPSPYALAPGEEDLPWRFRDGAGQALVGEAGPPIYEHADLDGTLFAALARDGIALFDPERGAALDAVRGAAALMGPRQQISRTYDSGERLAFMGYDTAQSPLLDMAHGYLQVLRDPAIQDVLGLVEVLLRDHEPAMSRLLEAAIEAARVGDAHPAVALEPGSPLWDDLIPVLRGFAARPGLIPDLLAALEQPEVARLGLRFRDFMRYKDRFSYDASKAVVGSFATPVDRSRPDSGFDRSLWQRVLHLIADSDQAVFCNKQGARIEIGGLPLLTFDRCDLIRIDDLAVFFVQSMVYAKDSNGRVIYDDGEPRRKATLRWNSLLVDLVPDGLLDDLLEDSTGIEGFRTHPTPEALSRMLFLDPTPEFLRNIMDPPVCRDGHVYRDQHDDTLAVWEMNGFYDQIRPILQVFADHDAEALFVDLLVVLNDHWPSRRSSDHQQLDPAAPDYAWASNVAAYEPLIADILARNTLLPALVETAPALGSVEVGGRAYGAILHGALRYLLEPQPGLAKRDGSTTSRTADGRPVPILSPWHVLADAYERKRQVLADGTAGDAWQRAASELVDILLRGEDVPGQGWRFRNPRVRGVGVAFIDFLQGRIAAHDAAGDRADWLAHELPARAEDMAGGPLFAAAADFVLALQDSPGARRQIESLLVYLLDEASYQATFRNALTALADVMQLAVLDDQDMLPIARLVGEALRPERGWVTRSIDFVHAARSTDQTRALARLARSLYGAHRPGHTPIGDLVTGLGEVHRTRPYRDLGQRFAREDYRAVLLGVADFLDEEKRGLRKLIAIIKGRHL